MNDLARFKDEMKARTKKFAHGCVKLALSLPHDQLGSQIKGQLIRSATSVAANYRASCLAQSVPQLISKMSIVIEEADESKFWLEFAKDENLVDENDISFLVDEIHQITSILIKSRHTLISNKK